MKYKSLWAFNKNSCNRYLSSVIWNLVPVGSRYLLMYSSTVIVAATCDLGIRKQLSSVNNSLKYFLINIAISWCGLAKVGVRSENSAKFMRNADLCSYLLSCVFQYFDVLSPSKIAQRVTDRKNGKKRRFQFKLSFLCYYLLSAKNF